MVAIPASYPPMAGATRPKGQEAVRQIAAPFLELLASHSGLWHVVCVESSVCMRSLVHSGSYTVRSRR